MKHWINTGVAIIAVSLISILFSDQWYFALLLTIVVVIYLTILSLGILFMQFNYFLKSKTKLKKDICLLTFDDGPEPLKTEKVLDILNRHNIKAVFFVIGEKVEKNPEIIKRIIYEGHLIGNHSYSHNKFMSMFTRASLRKDLDRAQEVIYDITGERTTYFRPPIGYTNPNYATVLRERSIRCVGWSLRSYDSVYKDPNQLADRLVDKIRPGQIILLHDNLQVTCDALESFIIKATSNGIIFASNDTIQTVLDE